MKLNLQQSSLGITQIFVQTDTQIHYILNKNRKKIYSINNTFFDGDDIPDTIFF